MGNDRYRNVATSRALDITLNLLAVAVGGALGSIARWALLLLTGPSNTVAPLLLTLGINVAGSFALGTIVGALGSGHARLRLCLGTGLCGGFTTYSAFALGAGELLAASPVTGVLLAFGALLLGVLAVAAGVWSGREVRESRIERRDRSGDPQHD